MKQLLAYRRPNGWSNTLMFVMSITFMIVWLPFIRSLFDGDTYQWGYTYFGNVISGAGLTPSFLFLIVQFALYAALIYGMYRMKNRMLYQVLLAIWWVNVFGNLLSDIIINGDTLFQGDTLGVQLSISMIVIPLSILALVLLVMFIRTEKETQIVSPARWRPINQTLWLGFLISLPLVFVLLFFGEPHATTDEIGVLIAIAHCFYLPFVFKPYKPAMQSVETA